MIIDFATHTLDGEGTTVLSSMTLKGGGGATIRNFRFIPGQGPDVVLVTPPKQDLTGPPR